LIAAVLRHEERARGRVDGECQRIAQSRRVPLAVALSLAAAPRVEAPDPAGDVEQLAWGLAR
jgi:hypothetical protein